MSSFTKHANIKPYGTKWINTKTFRFYLSDSKKGEYIEVPKGFIFDGCSIPLCIFGQKIEPDTLSACCLHDYMWSTKKYGFFESNYIFVVAMRVDGVSTFKKIRYYLGVTLFGWIIWLLKTGIKT